MDKGNIGHAFFLRKAFDMDELRKPYEKEFARGFKVEKVVELTEEQFQKFSSALSDYYRFLYDHRTDMYYDVGDMSYHCLLVTTPKYGDGILIEAEGYAYTRYAAYVPDCGRLELSGLAVIKQPDLSANVPKEYWKAITLKENAKQEKGR